MSKINFRLLIGIALIVQVFNYLGMRTIQWVWMNQNNFVNEYVPFLGLRYQSLDNFVYILLPDVIPILTLVLALVLANRYKFILVLAIIPIFAKLFLPIYDFLQWISSDLPIDQAVARSVRYQFLGYTNFDNLLLNVFNMMVTIGTFISLVLLSLLTIQRIKSERQIS